VTWWPNNGDEPVITYIDTSTVLKLVVDEPGSQAALAVWTAAESMASVSLIVVEARAALGAAARARRLTETQRRAAVEELDLLLAALHVVVVTDALVAAAAELAELEHLRGYDAVHLAAALSVGATVFSSADTALCDAAARRGLYVANPLVGRVERTDAHSESSNVTTTGCHDDAYE
jgi:predicted nucleic acid-binding protein